MANRFLNNIKINDSYTLPPADGTADQIIKTNGTGQLSFVDQGDVIAGEADKAKSVILRVKNSTASAMSKGQVVCEAVSATPPSGNLIEVALADNNGTNTMPALGILNEDLDAAGGANDEGDAIMFGKVSGIDTSAFSVGDEVFVDDTPGGLTTTKPTGVKYIQKVGVVIRDDASNGTIEVFGAGRVNDVPTPLYIDHPNQRLGIGTTSPTHKLQVVGNGAFNSTLDVQDPAVSDNGLLRLSHASTGSSLYSNPASSNVSTVVLRLGINNSEKMRIANNGNVGIGTTSPSTKFHLQGGIARFDNVSSNYLEIDGSDSNNNHAVISNRFNQLQLKTNTGAGDPHIALLPATGGNVGIGTTSPSEKLEVVGNIISTFTAVGTPALITSEYSSNNVAELESNMSGGKVVGTSEGGGFVISSYGDSHINYGNVGIGTTSPGQKLDVAGNIKMTETAATTDTDKFVVLDSGVLKYRTGSQIISDLPTDTRYVAVAGDTMTGTLSINRSGSGQIVLNNRAYFGTHYTSTDVWIYGGTGDTILLGGGIGGIQNDVNVGNGDFTVSNGDVGIGTTSPQEKLHVQNYTTGESHQAMFKGGAVTVGHYSYISLNNGYSTEYNKEVRLAAVAELSTSNKTGFAVLTSPDANGASGHERLRVTADGDVGIGTTSPNRLLTVQTAGTGSYLALNSSSNNTTIGSDVNGAFIVYDDTAAAYRMVIKPTTGNVGIGTTSPSQKLHVNGSVQAATYFMGSTSTSIGDFFGNIDLQSSGGALVRQGYTYKPITASAFNVSSDYRLKSNIVPLENAIDRLNQLEVRRFNWNDRLDEPKVDGFIAHEVAPIIPEAVLGEKDAVYEDGTPSHQGIDQAKIVPLLTAALQEAISKIENLEARIQILENQ